MKPFICGLFVAQCLALLLWARPVITIAKGAPYELSGGAAVMPKQCLPKKTSTEALGWRWKQGTLVRIFYAKDSFSAAEALALSQAVKGWNDALSAINSRIVFVASPEHERVGNKNASVTVMRGIPRGKERLGEIRFHSISNGMVQMVLAINPDVTDLNAMTSLMTHELGHTLGLADCYECRRGTTAMAAFKSNNQGNDVYEPSACDKFVVASTYAGDTGAQARAIPTVQP